MEHVINTKLQKNDALTCRTLIAKVLQKVKYNRGLEFNPGLMQRNFSKLRPATLSVVYQWSVRNNFTKTAPKLHSDTFH